MDVAMTSNCSENITGQKCNASLLMVNDYAVCSINHRNASVRCNGDQHSYNFTCTKPHQGDWNWDPQPDNLCSKVSSISTQSPSKATTRSSSISKVTSSTTTQTTRTATTKTQSKSLPTTNNASSEETVRSDSTEMSTSQKTAWTQSSTVTTETTISALTQTQMTGKTNTTNNTSLSARKSPEDSGSVVVPVVSVFVVVVITLVAVIVFLLWRHRRLKQPKAMGGYPGTSISNRGYENDHGLDRHISLLDVHPDDSVDSGYAEISPGKLNEEENPGNVYQTIDNIPEDKTECISGYGHLKMQTTQFIDNNYSHVEVNQNSKPSSDTTYAHTGNPLNAQKLKDDGENENTYNHAEKNARKIQGIQQPFKKEENKVIDDLEAEYNHAKAGQLSLKPDNKGDTYSHLNNTWQKPRGIQQDDLKFLTHGSKTQTYGTKTRKLDSDNSDGESTFSEYAKCAKDVNERETSKQVGRDGYETPAGIANIYFTIEPESTLAGTDVSFQVTNETFKDSESEESPNHQYFILEKT